MMKVLAGARLLQVFSSAFGWLFDKVVRDARRLNALKQFALGYSDEMQA
jgi:hypothetical protein